MPLPERPWLRDDMPLLWRDARTLQVGDDPNCRLDGLARDEAAWLFSLRGDRTLLAALVDAEELGLDRERAHHLLERLSTTGALDDAADMPASLRAVQPNMRDAFDAELRACRHVHRQASDANAAFDRRRGAGIIVHGPSTIAHAICLVLSQAGIGNVTHAESLSFARRHRARSQSMSCHILCSATPMVDDLGASALDVPHLAVRAAGRRATVGPFVLPGITGCLRCEDMHRADADPAWPRVAAQLSARRGPAASVNAALAWTCAGLVTASVIAWVEAQRHEDGMTWPAGWPEQAPPTVGGCLAMTLPGALPQWRPRPAHPLCGCRWRQAA